MFFVVYHSNTKLVLFFLSFIPPFITQSSLFSVNLKCLLWNFIDSILIEKNVRLFILNINQTEFKVNTNLYQVRCFFHSQSKRRCEYYRKEIGDRIIIICSSKESSTLNFVVGYPFNVSKTFIAFVIL